MFFGLSIFFRDGLKIRNVAKFWEKCKKTSLNFSAIFAILNAIRHINQSI